MLTPKREQVYLEKPPFGPGAKIRIIVIGQHVVIGSGRDAENPDEQEYSLAITGAGLQTLDDAECPVECVSECSGHGSCSPLEGGSGSGQTCVCDAVSFQQCAQGLGCFSVRGYVEVVCTVLGRIPC